MRALQLTTSGLLLAAMLVTAATLAGCAGGGQGSSSAGKGSAAAEPTGGRNEALNRWLATKAGDLPAADYRVGPPDRLVILAPKISELHRTGGVVRSDGKINLNLIGEVDVAGLTPAEISDRIAQRVRRFYTADALDITVQVAEYKSKVFYVIGQVITPGVKPFTGRDTVVKVLAEAKLNDEAWPQKVVLVRPHEDPNVRQRVTVDVKEMYTHGSLAQNYLVEEGDLLYIPLSPLAQFNVTFGRLLFPVRPVTDIAMMGAGL